MWRSKEQKRTRAHVCGIAYLSWCFVILLGYLLDEGVIPGPLPFPHGQATNGTAMPQLDQNISLATPRLTVCKTLQKYGEESLDHLRALDMRVRGIEN